MLFAPNSLVRQKEGAQGEEEEEAGGRRKGGPPQVQLGQGCQMRGSGEKMNGGVGFYSIGGAEWARDQSYLLTIGMDGATER